MLRTHPARNIGLFGCSAGGALVAESIAHFQRVGLPAPGVAGIYCAGAGAQFDGDSSSFAGLLLPSTPGQGAAPPPGTAPIAYFEGRDIARPDISPVNDLAILAHFPPTIFITGSRDFAASMLRGQRSPCAGVKRIAPVRETRRASVAGAPWCECFSG